MATEIYSGEKLLKNMYDAFHSRMNTDFYLAGGCVDGILRNTHFNDVDIFFETEYDFNKAVENITYDLQFKSENANTYTFGEHTIQLVKCQFGTIHDIMDGFDINKSRIAYGKDGVIKHSTFDEELYVDFKNFKSTTISRVLKYRNKKNYNINDNLLKIIDFLTENKQEKWVSYYNDDGITNGLQLLSKMLNLLHYDGGLFYMMYIQGKLDVEDFAVIIRECGNVNIHTDFINRDSRDLVLLLRGESISANRKSHMQNEYPEYFI